MGEIGGAVDFVSDVLGTGGGGGIDGGDFPPGERGPIGVDAGEGTGGTMAAEALAKPPGEAEFQQGGIAERIELDDVEVAGAPATTRLPLRGAGDDGRVVFIEESEVILRGGGIVEKPGLARGDGGEEASIAGEIAGEAELDAEGVGEGLEEPPRAAEEGTQSAQGDTLFLHFR